MAGLRISQEKNVSGWQVLGVTGAVPPSSVWNSAVFVPQTGLSCRGSGGFRGDERCAALVRLELRRFCR